MQPADIHALFLEAFNAADVDGLVKLYEPHATLVFGGEPLVGHDAIRAAYAGFVKQRPRMTLETRTVVESAEGLAILHGHGASSRAATMASAPDHGLSTEVVRRQADGSWRFIIDNPRTPA